MEIPRDGSIELGNTGFRFVRIDLLEEEATISRAKKFRLYCDIVISPIWAHSRAAMNVSIVFGELELAQYISICKSSCGTASKETVLCGWANMHPEMTTITRVFGAHEIVPRSIDLACEQYPLPRWLNNMSAYSMWYLIIMRDWFQQTGDIAYVRRHADYIAGVVALVDKKVDEKGNESLASWRFLDWPSSPDTLGVEAGYRALIISGHERRVRTINSDWAR